MKLIVKYNTSLQTLPWFINPHVMNTDVQEKYLKIGVGMEGT